MKLDRAIHLARLSRRLVVSEAPQGTRCIRCKRLTGNMGRDGIGRLDPGGATWCRVCWASHGRNVWAPRRVV